MDQNTDTRPTGYQMDEQIGFILRRASQRHLSIFAQMLPEFTPMQFAALAKLRESGAISQNALGRLTAMDAATIKGVVDRLQARNLVVSRRDTKDRRRMTIELSEEGRALIGELETRAAKITDKTLAPLDRREKERLLALLKKLAKD